MENSTSTESSISNHGTKQENSKFWETLFLGSIAAVGLLIGFSNGISLAKKNDETAFNKGLMMLPDRPNQPGTPKPPPMESGVRLAARALGIGSLYAFGGVSILSAIIWFSVGAKNLKDFRQKIGEKLPRIPRNNPPQGRTEFESFRDLFTYLAEESEKEKNQKENEKNDTR
ncbi:transmembrane protein 242-like protein [Euroglyphus maynei]|uniref:Transmembrane protein 242 n=1 Tax=Euroglyphus maynei TaxID=6958 RepID=A0A1Y3ASM6_EURMA|nr:transmembrane protein 242-like protein [Euroglyphus maynei]